MGSVLIVSLALLPPLLVAAWTWRQVHKAKQDLGNLRNFEGMHLEEPAPQSRLRRR